MATLPVVGPRVFQAASLIALVAGALGCAGGGHPGQGDPGPGTGIGPVLDAGDGAALYARHCAGCHGRTGDANTTITHLLFPAPRAFRDGVFKLASTQNGVPTEDDLVRTLRRGMPGSAMPAYDWLPDESLRALALHVVALGGQQAQPPGPQVRVPQPLPPTDDNLAVGEELYRRYCSACHGLDGTGRQPDPDWAGARELVWARDFTAGFLRGSTSFEELAYRIRAGMPGARMPPTELGDDEAALLIAHVQRLIPDGTDRHHVQWRRHLHAVRVPALPAAALSDDWRAIEAVRLPTAPLWWRGDAVFEVWLRAVHDGEHIAIQLAWDDPTRDDRALSSTMGLAPAGDGVALQLSAAQDPPQFAMGGGEAVNIWHWKSFRREDTAGAMDLLDDVLHRGLDAPHALPGVTEPQLRAESIEVHGPGEIELRRGLGLDVALDPVWQDGRWTVVLGRSLLPRSTREVSLAPGSQLLIALAVWDGAIDRQPGSKSVTTWHSLMIDP